MQFIGEYIKQSRINQNISLSDISNVLKISIRVLENIEDDHYPEDINNVFLIGHIRAYAKYLDLDHNKIVSDFKIQISYDHNNLNDEISKPLESSSLTSIPKYLAMVSAIFISAGFYFLFLNNNNLNSQYAMTPDVPENLLYSLEQTEMEISIKKMKVKNNNEKNINDYSNNLINTSTSSVIASIPVTNENNSLNKKITLKFLDSTWVQIRDSKNEIIYSKLMNVGDEYNYNLNDNFNLTAGNAGNIIVLMDGVVKGKIGKVGEVIDSLVIDKEFKN